MPSQQEGQGMLSCSRPSWELTHLFGCWIRSLKYCSVSAQIVPQYMYVFCFYMIFPCKYKMEQIGLEFSDMKRPMTAYASRPFYFLFFFLQEKTGTIDSMKGLQTQF